MRTTGDAFTDTPFGIWAIRVFLAVVFLVTGVTNLFGLITTRHAFAAAGLPDAMRVAVGLVEIAASVALVIPGLALPGAGALGICMLIMFVARLTHGNLIMSSITLLWLGLSMLVARAAWLGRPWRPDDPFVMDLPPPTPRSHA